MNTQVTLLHEPWRASPWVVRWYTDPDSQTGKQKRQGKLFKHSRDAKVFQVAKQAELDRGERPQQVEEVTLQRLIDEVFSARLAAHRHASLESYKNTTDQLIEYFGADRSIRDVHQRHAEAFLASRKRRRGKGRALASWTLYHHRKHCRVIFGAAVEWGYLTSNPFVASRSSSATMLRIRGRSRSWHYLTPDQFESMLAQVSLPHRRAAYWLMYACGLRPGEVYNLTSDRIDLVRRRVTIANRAATDDIPPFTVKADEQAADGKERSVPIPDAAMPDITAAVRLSFKSGGFVALSSERFATIQGYWRQCRQGQPWGVHPKHRPWLNRDMVNNLLRDTKGYLRKASVELSAPFALHTFRKSFAQNHANAGTPPRTLAKLMGHSDVAITMQFYNCVTDANERQAAETMNRLFTSVPAKQAQ